MMVVDFCKTLLFEINVQLFLFSFGGLFEKVTAEPEFCVFVKIESNSSFFCELFTLIFLEIFSPAFLLHADSIVA